MDRSLFDQVLQLVGLRVDDGLDFLNTSINDLTVVHIDERTDVGNGDGDQRQSPEGEELDQPVGIQGSKKGLQIPLESQVNPKSVREWVPTATVW